MQDKDREEKTQCVNGKKQQNKNDSKINKNALTFVNFVVRNMLFFHFVLYLYAYASVSLFCETLLLNEVIGHNYNFFYILVGVIAVVSKFGCLLDY